MLLLSAYPIKPLFCAFLFKIVAEFFYFVNIFLIKTNSLNLLFINISQFNVRTNVLTDVRTSIRIKVRFEVITKIKNQSAIKNQISYYFFRSVKVVR